MSVEGSGERNFENNPAIEKRIETFLKKLAKKFSTQEEVLEDIVREYVRMRPLPTSKEMKEWEAKFLLENKDRIRREVIINEVAEVCGIPRQVISEVILLEFLEEYPFPSILSQQEEWRDYLAEVCYERMDELQARTLELIEEEEQNGK